MDEHEKVTIHQTTAVPDGLDFKPCTNEAWREYDFGNDRVVRICMPLEVAVKRKPEGDSHRVIAQGGICHYIPAGWIALRWRAVDGKSAKDAMTW